MTANVEARPYTLGGRSRQMLEELRRYVICEPQTFVVDLERSQGMTLVTVDGHELFDWMGYYGSKLLGHNHPGLSEPGYVKRLVIAANNKVANPDFLTPECLAFYRKVYELAPRSIRNPKLEVYVVNSGAEAVENMMKYLVSRFNRQRQEEGKSVGNRRFIYFDQAFHGRTVYALGITQTMDPVGTKDFHGLTTGGNIKLPFPAYDADRSNEENELKVKKALEAVEMTLNSMAEEVVGIILEPMQGAGGQRVALPGFFVGLSELAERFGVALAFDEVQTGLGATGEWFAIDHYDLPYPPAAVATGKKFGNGVVYMREHLDDVGVLDSTWGGSLTDMVRVTRELEIVEQEGLVPRAKKLGDLLHQALKSLQGRHPGEMLNVRGLGLYQGFDLDSPARKSALVDVALEKYSLLLLGCGTRSIRLRPNLNVTESEIGRLVEILDSALADVS